MIKKKVLGIIPARLESSRLKQKPIIKILGLEMFAHVYFRAKECIDIDEIVVATDSSIIINIAKRLNIPSILTKESHKNPSERICEVADHMDADIYVLINGDEPLVRPEDISLSINTLLNSDSDASMLIVPLKKSGSFSDFKVVTDNNENVMYISRADIPYPYKDNGLGYLKKAYHIMSFYKETIKSYSNLTESRQEIAEQHEHIRLIEAGFKIKTKYIEYECFSVDTQDDLIWVKNKLKYDKFFEKYKNKIGDI